MRNQQYLICLLLSGFIRAEERLSWFTKDPEIKKSIFVPDNLPEGKEENRVLPWVFHDNEEYKKIELKCFMRGYNASNNPSDYKDARWSHPGFDDSQVDTSAPPGEGSDGAVPYRIWTMAITTSASDAGKKWATCEFQQGDFPLSTDFKFLIFRKVSPPEEVNVEYDTGGILDEKDLTKQVEDDIKRQISEYYNMTTESVTRSGNKFLITVPNEDPTPHQHQIEIPTPTPITNPQPQKQTKSIALTPPSSPIPITTPITNPIDSTNSTIAFFCKYGSKWMWRTCNKKVGKCPRMGDKAACRQFKVNLMSKTKPGKV